MLPRVVAFQRRAVVPTVFLRTITTTRAERQPKGTLTALLSSKGEHGKVDESQKTSITPPWTNTRQQQSDGSKERSTATEPARPNRRPSNKSRFRQHVNPLSRKFQLPTDLSDNWPSDVFDIRQRKRLHLDIGCGKAGFLLDLLRHEASSDVIDSQSDTQYNYLGLEIRPLVAQFAKERIQRLTTNTTYPAYQLLPGRIDVIGCNANVDLHRILHQYHNKVAEATLLSRVSIQFPDPHFKTQHAKRRVVNSKLVYTLAKYMPTSSNDLPPSLSDATVYLQSDIERVLQDMRQEFLAVPKYFAELPTPTTNLYGVPTEREVSVIEKNLPVYRAIFVRNHALFNDEALTQEQQPKWMSGADSEFT